LDDSGAMDSGPRISTATRAALLWDTGSNMFRKPVFALFPLLLCGAALAQDAPSVDDLVAKNVAARGGADKLKSIQTVKVMGTMTAPTGMQLPLTISVKRPGMIRTEMNLQGTAIVQAFDGTHAWSINPMTGSNEPTQAGENESQNVRNSADSFMDGPLTDYKARGTKVELAGKEDVNGSPAYKLNLTTKQGMEMTVYLDAKSYLEVRSTGKVSQMGQQMVVDSYPTDYKPEGGVLMAHTIESKVNGTPMMKMSMSKVEVNVPLDDSLFKMPAKPEAKPEAKKQ
jgi:outer membrane lipoprotein-sorting protein